MIFGVEMSNITVTGVFKQEMNQLESFDSLDSPPRVLKSVALVYKLLFFFFFLVKQVNCQSVTFSV